MRKPDQKSVTVGAKSFDSMWADLAASAKAEMPPPGSMSAREFAEKFDLPLDSVRNRLIRDANAGRVIATPVRVLVGRQMRTVIYYTPKRAA